MSRFVFILKTSRPGLWFPTIWLYLMPLVAGDHWYSLSFWVGLVYVCFPLNLLIYGWNDWVDRETDRLNPRKDSWLFGACGSDAELEILPQTLIVVQCVFWPLLIWRGGYWLLPTLLGIVLFSWIYNHPKWGWRMHPPLDLLCQIGYLLTISISVLLNDINWPNWMTMIYLCLFCLQSQIIGEIMDIDPDRAAGRKTTATVLGTIRSKLFLIGLVTLECLILGFFFQDWIFAGGLVLFGIWLLVDLYWFHEQSYTPLQFKLFGIGSNVAAFLSMIYVGMSGIFSS